MVFTTERWKKLEESLILVKGADKIKTLSFTTELSENTEKTSTNVIPGLPNFDRTIVLLPYSSSPLRVVRQAHHPDPELAEGGKTEMGVKAIRNCPESSLACHREPIPCEAI